MSLLLTNYISGITGILTDNEDRLQDPVYGYNTSAYWLYSTNTLGRPGYTASDYLKPRSNMTAQGMASSGVPPIIDTFYQNYSPWPTIKRVGGSQTRNMMFGYSLNAAAVAISGATIQLADSTANVIVDTVTSQRDGRFDVGSPYTNNCYAIGYSAGVPNLSGMTDTTLIGFPSYVPVADGIPADIYIDFINQIWWGTSLNQFVAAFSRSSVAWGDYQDGHWVQFPAGVPVFTDKGWEAVPLATNLALWCRDMTNAAWTKTNMSAALTQTGIDNTLNSATLLTATAGSATVLQAITQVSTADAYSVFLQRVTGTGTVNITMDGGSTWTPVTLTNSWQRFQVLETVTNPSFGIQIITNGDQVAADFNQLEATSATISFPTTPILTTSGSVSRTGDRLDLPFPFPISSSMTMQMTGTPRGGNLGNMVGLVLNDGTNVNRYGLEKTNTIGRAFNVVASTITNISPGGTITWSDSVQGKVAMSSVNGFQAASFNGQVVGTAAAPTPSGIFQVSAGQFNTALGWWDMSSWAIWLNHAASNTALQALST